MSNRFEDIANMFGPRNVPWVKRYVESVLRELNFDVPASLRNEDVLSIVEKTLHRAFDFAAGCPIGQIIGFEISEALSQKALDSIHDIGSLGSKREEEEEEAEMAKTEFLKATTFSALLSCRKSRSYVFMSMKLPPQTRWKEVEPDIYAVPLKQVHEANQAAEELYFATQPYVFPNEICVYASSKNLFLHYARKHSCEHLMPLLSVLSLVSAKTNPPLPFSRHGLRGRGVDFLNRASFEDVLSAFETGALDQETVGSDNLAGSLFTSCKPAVGTSYFDLIEEGDEGGQKCKGLS